MKRRLAAGLAALALAAGIGVTTAQPAAAWNGHTFYSMPSSTTWFYVSNNTGSAADYKVYPGKSHKGDCVYFRRGTEGALRFPSVRTTWKEHVRGWYCTRSLVGTGVRATKI
jgi:hypothetical protein